jgi:hypothetical protein
MWARLLWMSQPHAHAACWPQHVSCQHPSQLSSSWCGTVLQQQPAAAAGSSRRPQNSWALQFSSLWQQWQQQRQVAWQQQMHRHRLLDQQALLGGERRVLLLLPLLGAVRVLGLPMGRW